jgi:RHS repeat-associated protein
MTLLEFSRFRIKMLSAKKFSTECTMESNTGMIVRDTGYSWPSLVSYRSMPYAGSGLNRTPAQTNEALIARYRYDALNRVVSEANVMGETTYAYNDWTTTVTDTQKGGKKLYYDAYGNMTRIDEFSPNHYDITWYGYDGNKNLTGIADALGNERYFTYDLLGRRITAEDLHAKNDTTFGKYSFTYDAAGNVLTVTDPENARRTFVYDALGRITSDDSTLTPNVEAIYTYDWCGSWGKGRLCSVNAQGVITNYTHDTRGRIVQESRMIPGSSVAYTTVTTYDIQNNPVTITYPNSAKVFYKYNNIGKVENVQLQASASAAAQNLVTNYDYHVSGAPLREELTSGVVTHYTYDTNELYRLRNRKVNKGTALYDDVTYTYDKVGNITRISDSAPTLARRTVDYVYDGYYRITSAKTTAVNGAITTENFAYNKIGNIVSSGAGAYLYEGATSVAAGTAFANPHAPTKIANAALTYDKKGNVLTYSNQTYTWDHANRLTRIVDTGTSGTQGSATPRTTNYLYDHAGQRVRKVSGTTTTLYPNKYFEVEGEIVSMYIWANDQLVSAITKNNTFSSTEYIHKDHLGSTKVITDANGNVVSLFNYTPFGEELILKNNSSVDRHFIGEWFDEETQMSYLNARYLQNKRGQFLSQDPVFWEIGLTKDGIDVLKNPQAQNSYSYAGNNPITLKDPTGRAFLVDDAAGFLVGGLVGVVTRGAVNLFTGQQTTWGQVAGSFVTGGIIGVGAVNTPETLGASNAVSAAVVTGLIGGFYGNVTEQGVDIATGNQTRGVDLLEAQKSGLITAGTNGVLQGTIPNAKIPGLSVGRGNMSAVGKGILTKGTNGTIQNITVGTGLKSAVGSQANDFFRTGVGTIIDSFASLITNKNTNKKQK